jgi:hypothetical protein
MAGNGDPHYHLDHPWQHGHFRGVIGTGHVWRMHGGDRGRLAIGGFFLSVGAFDWVFCDDWLWDSEDIVIHDDPDHIGCYDASWTTRPSGGGCATKCSRAACCR